MKVIKQVCPNCKANLELDDTREFGFCQYCGTKILLEKEQPNTVVNQAINNTVNITINNSSIDNVINDNVPDKLEKFEAIKSVYQNGEFNEKESKNTYSKVCLLLIIFVILMFLALVFG